MLKIVLSEIIERLEVEPNQKLEPDTLIIEALGTYRGEVVHQQTYAVFIRSELGDTDPVGYFDFELIQEIKNSVKEQARAHVAKAAYLVLNNDPSRLLHGLEIRFNSFTFSQWTDTHAQA